MFKSTCNLTDMSLAVLTDGVESDLMYTSVWCTHVSVLRSLLFTIYTSRLGKIIHELGIMYHRYANNIQLHLSFKMLKCSNAVAKMEECICIIRTWMSKQLSEVK